MRTMATSFIALLFLCITLPIQAGANEDLIKACRQGDLAGVKAALEAGANVNTKGNRGNTALGNAYLWPEITSYLLEKGADVNAGGYPALVSAAANSSLDVVRILLKAGADVNRMGILMHNPAENLQKLVDAEIAKGPEASQSIIKTWKAMIKTMPSKEVKSSAAQLAVQQSNCAPCLEMLLDAGADPKQADAEGNNLAHLLALFAVSPDERKEMYARKAESMQEFGFKTPDWYRNLDSKRNGTPEAMLELLAKAKVDLNAKTNEDYTPLLMTLGIRSNASLGKAFLKHGASATDKNTYNQAALSMAAMIGDVELLKMLVEKGADLNNVSKAVDRQSKQMAEGFTPLLRAVMYNRYDAAKYLIEAGAKPKDGVSGFHVHVKTGCPYELRNKTSIYYAIDNNNLEMVKLLCESFKKWDKKKLEIESPKPSTTYSFGNYKTKVTNCYESKGVFTPSAYAEKMGQKDIRDYLKSAGY